MTNFSAVCVGENPTTFTSTRPAALPAAIDARSEISGRPFGRMIHSAPFGFSDAFSVSRRGELRLRFDDAEKDRVAVLDDAADREYATAAFELLQKRLIVDADRGRAPRPASRRSSGGATADAESCRPISAPPRRASNDADAAGMRHASACRRARSTFDICLNGIDEPQVAAAEMQDLGFEPRLPARASVPLNRAVHDRLQRPMSAVCLSVRRGQQRAAASLRETARSRSARWFAESRAVRAQVALEARARRPCPPRAAPSRPPSESDPRGRRAARRRFAYSRSSARPLRADAISPTTDARRTHMLRSRDQARSALGERRDAATSSGPISDPQIASVVAQFANVAREPALPHRQQRGVNDAPISRDDLDADRLHLEMPVGDQRFGEGQRVVDRPVCPVGAVDRRARAPASPRCRRCRSRDRTSPRK